MNPLTPTDIILIVSRITGVSYDDMLGHCRATRICDARMIAAQIAYELTDASFPDIGRAMNKAHSSVQYMLRRLPERRRCIPMVAYYLDACWLAARKAQQQPNAA